MKKLLCLGLLSVSLLTAMNIHEDSEEKCRTALGLLTCGGITGFFGLSTFYNGAPPGIDEPEPYSVVPMVYGTIMLGGSMLCLGKVYYDLRGQKRSKTFRTNELQQIIVQK